MTNVASQFETRLERRPPAARCWWALAFVISFLVLFLSTLFLLSEDASAKPGGKPLEATIGGHNGGDKGGGTDGLKGGGDRSPVKEAANAVGDAQRGEQSLKGASNSAGGADRAVGKEARLASEVADLVTNKHIDEPSKIAQPVADKSTEITRPLVKEIDPLVEHVKDVAEPVVKTAGRPIEPVGAAASPLVEPVAETTRPLVEPVKEVAAPMIELADEIAGPVTEPVKEVVAPVVDPLGEIAGPFISPVREMATTPLAAPVDTGLAAPAVEPGLSEPLVSPSSVGQLVDSVNPAATMPMDEAVSTALLTLGEPFGAVSHESVVLHSELASAGQDDPEGSADASTGSLASTAEEASSLKAAEAPGLSSKALISGFVAALQGAVSSIENIAPIQIPQLLGAASAAAGSLSGGASSDSGTGLGILALVLVSLLGGKSLLSARELLKPSTALIPIIERPG